ncbi:DNA topoisomerase (ATP-hydrolyzing) subunit A [Ureaplasma urealyticum]|uniref:DNA gyrase subunit A n=3 Tax=Ureaplasma urealyticum TaxID=2130 RepID=A0AAP9ABV1_UREUR|nr:DNA topoisomerase (ATP-hydrolyzing) subunit A [Ureaplasma urealyticum]EDX54189.1 DNA gyrase, A subunit [Ureaplasma urealyticum serovar 9 str. ATCC 33175]EDU06357.1 DNA gyrase, A subunit [Ureaplasma urealyticum serovar 5 str. ATCC 27817]EDU56744.1 DNA gyrase, A subunit [Ureaplasma urealyticum serovar 7 str. ATCC 27819]EDU66806.1 DNA gyrase, A subunit [Ureaplasma urealyticum serovar 11 str. ATCC 33695]EDX53202.1 DNA gyrase, A subunit [Ureaplasma urealyticum serovar 12 str. ATCC 33696]
MALKKPKKSRLTTEEIKQQLEGSTIKEQSITKEVETSFLDYSMSVIVARALPDVRDGFKPVHRRALFAAFENGMTHDKPYKKSARWVGDVIGKYHPHGDQAVYQTIVRMAQEFSMRYLLVDGHGNFGSIDGDSAAAMRYTEARLSKISYELLKYIDKETVDFVPNYDASEQEPSVLPSGFPNLLTNGTTGIAVGMATNIPPHNLTEVCQAIKAYAKNHDISIPEIMEHLKGPDFPTGAEIYGDSGIINYFNTGRGSVTIRSKYEIEDIGQGRVAIVVTEIPYMVNKVNLIEKIVELVTNKQIEGISDLRDESSRDGIRIVIEVKRDVIPEVLLNKLFKTTALQTNFSVNNLALVNGVPMVLNIKEMIKYYFEHQIEVLVRRTKFDLRKAKERIHIVEGLVIAVNNIDEVIKIIKASGDDDIASKALIARFGLTELQTKAILEMRLRALTGLNIDKLKKEYEDLLLIIKDLEDILENYDRQVNIICENLDYLIEKFGDERRTEIMYGVSSHIDDEDLIPVEDIVVTMSKRGYFKRLPIDTYKNQRRGGVGVQGLKTYEDDDVEKILVANTHTDLLFFSDLGRVYRLRGHEVPLGSRQSKGIPAINFLPIEKSESILTILPIDNYEQGSLFFTTSKGIIKRANLSDFESIRANGKIAITLKEGDKLFSVMQTLGNDEVFIGASNGNVIRFNENDAREMGRIATGVKGINLEDDEYVVGTGLSSHGEYVLAVGSKGLGKLTDINDYRLTKRGAKGVNTLKVNDRTGNLVSIKVVNRDEEALIITTSGKVIRLSIQDISVIGRNTSGVKLISLENKEEVKSIAIFKKEEIDDNDDEQQTSHGNEHNLE